MRHTIVRDGIVAGVLGATAVVVFFLGLEHDLQPSTRDAGGAGTGTQPELRSELDHALGGRSA